MECGMSNMLWKHLENKLYLLKLDLNAMTVLWRRSGQEQVLRFSSLESTLPCLISLPVDSEKRNLGQIRVILELMLPMLHVMTQALLRENNRHCRGPGGFFGFALQKALGTSDQVIKHWHFDPEAAHSTARSLKPQHQQTASNRLIGQVTMFSGSKMGSSPRKTPCE